MKLFELRRDEDTTGISGTGTVAQGVIFDNGQCALTWLTKHTSCAVYPNIEAVVAIHGHDGKTRVVQFADLDRKALDPLTLNTMMDDMENIAGCVQTEENYKYLWSQREKFADLFNERDLAAD